MSMGVKIGTRNAWRDCC